jgi:hypothetical protein
LLIPCSFSGGRGLSLARDFAGRLLVRKSCDSRALLSTADSRLARLFLKEFQRSMKRTYNSALAFFGLLVFLLALPPAAEAQQNVQKTLSNTDFSANVTGQFTDSTDGNGIHQGANSSTGALFQFHQSFKPWLGYEINYGYQRFSEHYDVPVFGGINYDHVQNNVHEFTAAYLVKGPTLLGLHPFASLGTGALVFSPTSSGGNGLSSQTRMVGMYAVGADFPIVTSHFGVRAQYRGLVYRAPDFDQAYLNTSSHRVTNEPTIGAFIRF